MYVRNPRCSHACFSATCRQALNAALFDRLVTTKRTIDELQRKLEAVELKTLRNEDRARQIERAIEDEKTQQHRLTELFARELAKKHTEKTRLADAHSVVKHIQTENTVCSSSSSSSRRRSLVA